jgi:hypothetical protein
VKRQERKRIIHRFYAVFLNNSARVIEGFWDFLVKVQLGLDMINGEG